ncbi:hypothetical protein M3685_20485 [Heyndrickxia oleronia]|jgi:hypothetical protein|uniref:hypothetical protein n=1 Tax=Heyndrickxia oleronia TaxID=38875 RepID=UPI0020424CE7|nr:hypothetical protein [Heyndrickxia oleronia]MCM3456289.1 hypothetical protein [Heyndrickxia oleronia]
MKDNSKFKKNDLAKIIETDEQVTILKSKYISNMKRYSYIVKEYPATFYFEEELEKL